MHELGIVYQIVRTVDEVKDEQNLSEIESIVLQIGEMSDVVPRFIAEAWKNVAPTTDYPNAKFELEIIPAVARCTKCGNEDKVKNIGLTCSKCGSSDFKIISGREFMIKQIVAK